VKVVFEEPASVELTEAADFYESARPGTGEAFLHAVEGALQLLAEYPRIAPMVVGTQGDAEVRQKLIEEFGVRIVYAISKDELRVFALAHTSREPGYWQERLGPARKR
jgi:hypothetical protein